MEKVFLYCQFDTNVIELHSTQYALIEIKEIYEVTQQRGIEIIEFRKIGSEGDFAGPSNTTDSEWECKARLCVGASKSKVESYHHDEIKMPV